METVYVTTEKYLLCSVKGRLDNATAEDFVKSCKENIFQTDKPVILDCSELTYISSAGLRCVLMLIKRRSPDKVCLFSVPERVKEIIIMADFYKFIPMYDSLEEAVVNAEQGVNGIYV